LVPARVRVVVPYFPSPESLPPSFSALRPGNLTASAASRLSSSGPQGALPIPSARHLLSVSAVLATHGQPRGRSIPALAWSTGVTSRACNGREYLLVADPRARLTAQPKLRRFVELEGWSPIRPLPSTLRRCRTSARTGIVLVSTRHPSPPFCAPPEETASPKGGCLPPSPRPRVFHGPSVRSPSGCLRNASEGRCLFVPLRTTGPL